ncbi:MAG: hypothetical protein ACOX3K_03435 [Bacilli bacterium]|jgi:hypothetical protein
MNSINSFILSIYQVALIVRDTLEYTIKNHKVQPAVYLERKKAWDVLTQEKAPLMTFIANNEEKSEKFKENLAHFKGYVFGEEDAIVQLSGEEVVVDRARNITIFESVIGIYQTLLDIIRGYLKYAKEQNAYEEAMEDLLNKDEFMFRVTSHLVLVEEMFDRFTEFNKVMRESNGQPGPLTNFVVEDMKKINGMIQFSKAHNQVKDYRYHQAVDKVMILIALIEGKRQLEPEKTLPQFVQETRQGFASLIAEAEKSWRDQFQKVMQDAYQWSQKQTKKEENLA